MSDQEQALKLRAKELLNRSLITVDMQTLCREDDVAQVSLTADSLEVIFLDGSYVRYGFDAGVVGNYNNEPCSEWPLQAWEGRIGGY